MRPTYFAALSVATAAIALHPALARAERPPAIPPAIPAPISAPSLQLEPVRVGPYAPAPSFERLPFTLADRTEWLAHTRLRRLALGSLVSLATASLLGAASAGTIGLGFALCPSFCTSTIVTAVAVPSVVALAATFAMPAAFLAGAERYGVRGSYWATFGGLWAGLAISSAITATTLALAPNSATVSIASMLSVIVPFASMAVAFELTAYVFDEQPMREQRARTARAPSPSAWGAPLFAADRERVTVGWTGSF